MSSNGWMKYRLGDLILSANTGLDAIQRAPIVDRDTGIKCLRIQDVSQKKEFNNWGFCEVSESNFEKFQLRKDDIIIARTGETVGVNLLIKQNLVSVFNNGLIRLRTNSDKLFPQYLYYSFQSKLFVDHIYSVARGTSTQPNMRIEALLDFEINLPNYLTQHKITSILSSLDEKIENNLATNQTLEEIASILFKEWFVNFNYPNADGGRKHSEFGEIPISWREGTLGDIYKTTSGGTPSRAKMEYYENGIYQWVKSKELNNTFIIDTEEKITEAALKSSSAKVLPKHSVLIAMYGATVGEIGITTDDVTCNQAICAFLPNEDYPYTFIYHFLLQCKQDIINQAVGSAQQNISQQLLLQYKLAIPKSEIVKEFHKVVSPLFEKIKDNIEENETLTNLRDSLLPKLMSGQIEIKISNS